jgi:hypothetical protein
MLPTSHCDTCKLLSGAPYTLNQIIPLKALNITKGKDNLGKYTYKGDSGKGVNCVSLAETLSQMGEYTDNGFKSSTARTAPRTCTTTKRPWARTQLCCAPCCSTRTAWAQASSPQRRSTARRGLTGRRRLRRRLRLCRLRSFACVANSM